MKVFLKKDIEKVGMSGEIVKVSDGYARNYLFPRNLAIKIDEHNTAFFEKQVKKVEDRKEVIATQTSMLAERIKSLKFTLKRKMHDDGELYGVVRPAEIMNLLAEKGITVAKNQIEFDKPIKTKGTFEVTIKLTSRLKPKTKVVIIPD